MLLLVLRQQTHWLNTNLRMDYPRQQRYVDLPVFSLTCHMLCGPESTYGTKNPDKCCIYGSTRFETPSSPPKYDSGCGVSTLSLTIGLESLIN